METLCLITTCAWYGSVNHLYNHCKVIHPNIVKVIDSNSRFTFTYAETVNDVFLLRAPGGLYWFLFNPASMNGIYRGIFKVKGSRTYYYNVKLGSPASACIVSIGPCETRSNYKIFDLFIPSMMLDSEDGDQKCIEVHFDDYKDLHVHHLEYCEDVKHSSTELDEMVGEEVKEENDMAVNKQMSQISVYSSKPSEKSI